MPGKEEGFTVMADDTPPFRRAEKISDIVALEIVHDIRGMAAGAKLPPEAVMLGRYQVGRASLREALRLLEAQGLIVLRTGPGGGPVVAPVDSRYFARMSSLYFHLTGVKYRDLVEARLVMEPVMARLAATRQDAGDRERLQQFVDSVEAGRNSVPRELRNFHGLLSGMSGNPVLDLMGRSLQDLPPGGFEGLICPPEGRFQQTHAAIATAVIGGDEEGAEDLMHDHMTDLVRSTAENDTGALEKVMKWG